MSHAETVPPVGCSHPDGCLATVKIGSKWDHLRAHTEGWFFTKDGQRYCPDHHPAWVAEWRARKARGEVMEPWSKPGEKRPKK